MRVVQGDLLALGASGTFDVIVHGCNCFHAMGKGIAKSVKMRFPAAFEADLATEKGSQEKLGTYSLATVDLDDHKLTIINGYTQYHWRGSGSKLDYGALQKVFARLKAEFSGRRIGYPLIGAGLAGGNWDEIASIIDAELAGEDHCLVEYRP